MPIVMRGLSILPPIIYQRQQPAEILYFGKAGGLYFGLAVEQHAVNPGIARSDGVLFHAVADVKRIFGFRPVALERVAENFRRRLGAADVARNQNRLEIAADAESVENPE